MNRLRARLDRAGDDRGSAPIEMVVLAPVLGLILSVIVFSGRVASAHGTVEQAAADAARDASIARDASSARRIAISSATASLRQEGVSCTSIGVDVDVTGFGRPVGQEATVRATVTCVVPLADLAIPGLPGSRVITATAFSPLDTWRGRSG